MVLSAPTAAMLPKPVEVDAQHGHDVVLLDDDDENNDKSTASTSVIHALSATAQEADASVPVEDENVVDDEDDTSDAESFFEEILHNVLEGEEAEPDDTIEPPFDICSPSEIQDYRDLLRKLGPNEFIMQTVTAGKVTPRKLCTAFNVAISSLVELSRALAPGDIHTDEEDEAATTDVWYRLLGMAIMRFMLTRQKLPQYNTIEDVAALLQSSKNILVITGAGISTNLGIPDFRSKNTGFYAKLAEKGFSDPTDVFDLATFKEDPRIFFEHAGETFPELTRTSPTHKFIRLLQDNDKLLTNYTQNIDNLEEIAGITEEKLIQCHGSWATATCLECGHKVRGSAIKDTVKQGNVPHCTVCIDRIEAEKATSGSTLKRKRSSGTPQPSKKRKAAVDLDDDENVDDSIPTPGVLKPDITFFGEQLPTVFFKRFKEHDLHAADLVLVIGTSMKVAPVSEIPLALPASVPQVYISKDPCRHITFDVQLLGDCDAVVGELVKRVGWDGHGVVQKSSVVIEAQDTLKAWWDVTVADG